MITESGTELISKYLAGQASSYAYAISIGSGARPLSNTLPIQFNASATVSSATSYLGTNWSTTGTIGSVVGGGPATATITGLAAGAVGNFVVGDVIWVTGTGAFGSTGITTVTDNGGGTGTTITVSSTTPITPGAITGLYTAPYTATVTVASGEFVTYIEPGDKITATAGAGTIGPGDVYVTAITGPRTFTVTSDAQIVNGAITALKTSTALSSYASQTKLNFEMERFPIESRSYIVEQQAIECVSLEIVSATNVLVTTDGAHPFVTGDIVALSNVIVLSGTPYFQDEVNGTYKVVSITDTTFTAQIYYVGLPDYTFGAGDEGTMYYGSVSNNSMFSARAFTRQVSLTASMTEPSGKSSRYDIAEMGIYSLANNNLGKSDVGTVLDFADDGFWTYVTSTTETPVDTQTTVATPFSDFGGAWFVGSSNSWWNPNEISLRQEKPRFKDDALVVAGDLSQYDNSTNFAFTSTSKYVKYSNFSIDLSNAAPSDTFALAFSIANAVALPTAIPTSSCIMLEFVSTKPDGGVARIKFKNDGTIKTSGPLSPFETFLPILPGNRYVVLESNVSDIEYVGTTATTFVWTDATVLRVYAAMQVGTTPTADYSFILDGFRYNNTTTQNPLYALTGYTQISNATASKLVKDSNTNGLINFRVNVSLGA